MNQDTAGPSAEAWAAAVAKIRERHRYGDGTVYGEDKDHPEELLLFDKAVRHACDSITELAQRIHEQRTTEVFPGPGGETDG